MRYREQAGNPTTGFISVEADCVMPNCPGGGALNIAYTSSQTFDSMVDVDTPTFRELSASGELVFSPMYQENLAYIGQPSVLRREYQNSTDHWRQHWVLYPGGQGVHAPLLSTIDTADFDAYLSEFQSEREIALTAAWANVDESELLAYASLGELPETIKWLADCFRRFIKVLALFRAKKVKLALMNQFRKPLEVADALANFWLEMRYAVRPLAFEMEQIIAAIDSATKPARRTARGFHSSSDNSSDTTTEYFYYLVESVDVTRIISRKSEYRAGVLYELGITDGNWIEILGFDKPLESIYELTKLSFVVDWFLNIGDLLSSFTTSANLTPLGSWIVEEHVFTEYVRNSNFQAHRDPDYSKIETLRSDYGYSRATRRLKRRIISPDKPSFPHVNVNLNVAKIVDLAAIARSIYREIR